MRGDIETHQLMNVARLMTVLTLLLFASKIYSRAPAAYSLEAKVSPRSAQAGSKIFLEVSLTNTTAQGKVIQICTAMRVECNFEVFVRDANGSATPATRLLRAIRNEPQHGTPTLAVPVSYGTKSIEPGETIKFVSDLSTLYVFNRPDTYTVQVSRVEDDVTLWSSPVKFIVTPNPQLVPVPEPCTKSAEVMITVSDPSGAFVQDALLVFRMESGGSDKSQLKFSRTSANGTARITLPCGAVDLFVTANGLSPYAQKIWIEEDSVSLPVTLK
jgi:hypothetical protein